MLSDLSVERGKAVHMVSDLELCKCGGRIISTAHLMMIVSPINAYIQQRHDLTGPTFFQG